MPRPTINRDAAILALLPATRFQIAAKLNVSIKVAFHCLNSLKARDLIHSKRFVDVNQKLWEVGPLPPPEPEQPKPLAYIPIPHEPLTALYGRYDQSTLALLEGN